MLRVPKKISSKPNEVSVTLSSTTSATPRSISNPKWQYLCLKKTNKKKAAATRRGTKTSRTLRHRMKKPSFQSISLSLPPLSLSRMSSISLDVFCFVLLFDFHVDVISKLCLWLSPFVFDWSLTGQLRTQPLVVMLKRERRKCCFYGTVERERECMRERERKCSNCLSSLTSPLVKVCMCVCINVCVSVSLCQ